MAPVSIIFISIVGCLLRSSCKKQICRTHLAIIIAAVVITEILIVIWFLGDSHLNLNIDFQYIQNENTGQATSLFESLLVYGFIYFIVASIFCSITCLIAICVYFVLHIKDKHILERQYHPEYEEEYYSGSGFALISACIIAFIVLLLIMLGIVQFCFPF